MTIRELKRAEYEAIKSIKSIKRYVFDQEWNTALNIAIDALEKQIPNKPIYELSAHALYDSDGIYLDEMEITTFKCPACNDVLASGEISEVDCTDIRYCNNCGQKLDWSESE